MWDGVPGLAPTVNAAIVYDSQFVIGRGFGLSTTSYSYDGLMMDVRYWGIGLPLSVGAQLYAEPWAMYTPRARVFRAAAAGPGGPTIPSPVVVTWSVAAPSAIKRLNASAVSANWSVVSPTVRKRISPSPAQASWSVRPPVTGSTVVPSPATAAWSVGAPTLRKRISPTPATTAWTAPAPTCRKTMTANPIGVAWSVQQPGLAKQCTPAPAQSTWSINEATLTKRLHAAAVGLTWRAIAPSVGAITRTPDPVTLAWTAGAPTPFQKRLVRGRCLVQAGYAGDEVAAAPAYDVDGISVQ